MVQMAQLGGSASSTAAASLVVMSLLMHVSHTQQQQPQPKQPNNTSCIGRRVYNDTWGIVTDGAGRYPDSAHCEWLIQGM